MGTRRYRDARLHLIELIEVQIEQGDNSAKPVAPKLKKAYRDEAEDIVDAFEDAAERRSYWRGVWQSFWGAWLYTLSLGIIPLVLWCSHLDFREMVNRFFAHPKQEQKSLPAAATPDPAATPAPTP